MRTGTLLLIYALGQYQATYVYRQQAAAAERAEGASHQCYSALGWSFCFANDKATEAEAERSEHDLQAQEDMAEWAKWITLFTALQVAVGIGGTVLLVGNLNLAREANKVTRDIGQAQVRAYVAASQFQMQWHQGNFVVGFTYTNIGQSPAKHARAGVAWRYGEKADRANFPRFVFGDFVWQFAGDVERDGEPARFLAPVQPPVTAEEYRKAVAKSRIAFFAVHVAYKDVFGKWWTEKYRLYAILSGRDWTQPQRLQLLPISEQDDDEDESQGTPVA